MRNLPTLITISRLFFAVGVSFLIFFSSTTIVIICTVLFILGSLSDALDGAFARKQSKESKFGAFLDPIADKIFVFIVLISLVYNRDSLLLFIITISIISREIIVMSLREWMAIIGRDKMLEVSSLGKLKTIIQMAGISLFITSPIIKINYFYEFTMTILIIGTIIGFYSAFRYIKQSIIYIK
ncbi:MAG: CDP-diacylglycerol--glycerol-3-phosphate 3-phosphatidyltransferase [Chloroflexi bacterium]|nr:CDP-diacylglycerol--glycerol-3-phosphate 3-phosphatidyltransferase [Chloroflexota bacterium]